MKRITLFALLTVTALNGFAQELEAKINYQFAFDELRQMIQGKSPVSFKRAVFITENAYLDNRLSYEDFNKRIDALVNLTKAVAEADGLKYDHKDRQQVLLAGSIFRVMKDSLFSENTDKTKKLIKSPYLYDMEDFWGEANWTKMFVNKLLYTQSGNCHSLPALYKILADELNVDAWLALAPNHTYIKQWSDKTGWYNTELTTGGFPFDHDIKFNSYIKTETIASGVYMDTLSEKESIAYVITDLVQGYIKKFGYEDSNTLTSWLQCALGYYPDYINALIVRAELQKKQYEMLMEQKQTSDFKTLWSDEILKEAFTDIEQSYFKVHQFGYRRMPKEMYLNWLFRVKNDSTRKPFHFQAPQPFKNYNYNVQIATAGDGQNYEFFDQDSLTRIGTAMINIINGRIVAFVNEDEENAMPDEVISRMYDPAMGRWWQVDPKAEKYYSISPYAFVANNPVLFVDPDGQEIWINYGDNQRVKYENGKLYNEDGSKYKGDDAFVSTTYKTLNHMNSTKNGKAVLGELTGSENAFNFTNTMLKDSKGNEIMALNFEENENGGGEIHAGALMKDTDIGQKVENVAHELYHGYQHEQGQGGASINNEVEAYVFGRSVALQTGLAYNYSFGNNSVMGSVHDDAMLNLLTGQKFDPSSFQRAVMTFKTGSRMNSTGLYSRGRYLLKKPLIGKFYPLLGE